jgi:hypothetical protein
MKPLIVEGIVHLSILEYLKLPECPWAHRKTVEIKIKREGFPALKVGKQWWIDPARANAWHSERKTDSSRKDFSIISRLESVSTGFVYFAQYHNNSPIKIGFTRNLEKRLISLRGQCPGAVIIKAVEGNLSDERKYHERFKHLREYSEWFRREKELVSFIKNLSDGATGS